MAYSSVSVCIMDPVLILWRNNLSRRGPQPDEPVRVRVPNRDDGEIFGIIIQMLGYDRVRVRCEDGNIRVGRIPGRMKKRVWMRVGDTVIVVPWDFQSDEKADVIWRYRGNELEWLKKRGILKMF